MLAAENARNDSSLVLIPTLHALDRPFPLIAAVTHRTRGGHSHRRNT